MSTEIIGGTANRIILCWSGPYAWTRQSGECFFDASIGREPGIYIWAIEHGDSFLAYYVGETGRNFVRRLTEHTKEYLSGVYRTYDCREFSRGAKKLLWDGLWKEHRLNMWPDFLERYTELAPHILGLLRSFRLFLAPTHVDRKVRKRIENSIGAAIQHYDEQTRAFFDDTVTLRRRRRCSDPISVVNRIDHDIIGLPSSLEA